MQLDDPPTLEIRIDRAADGRYAVEMRIGEREFPAGALAPEILALGAEGQADEGARLFAAFVADDRVRMAWELAAALHPRRRIRVRLDDSVPELHVIPWEVLHDPSPTATARFLAADRDTPFSRDVSCPWQPLGPVAAAPIRVLTAIAAPRGLDAYGLAPIDRDAEIACLAAAMSSAPAGLVEHTALAGPCTLAALEAELERGYHVLHLVAHGVLRRGGNSEISSFLELEDGGVDRVDAGRFAGMVERLRPSLRLAVMMSCSTAARSPTDPAFGFAPALLAAGIPAVLAMQDRMPMTTAAAFTRAFYSELWQCGEIDRAANRARAVVLTERLPGGAVPVLYGTRASLRLWSLPGPAAAAPVVAPPAPAVESPPERRQVDQDMSSKTVDSGGWQPFGGPATDLVAAREADGRLVLFTVDEHDVLRQRRQSEPGGEWGAWEQLSDEIHVIDVVADPQGRLSLFALDADGAAYQMAQTAPAGPWGEWVELGGASQSIAAACRRDGRMLLAARDERSRVRTLDQRRPGGPWGEWHDGEGEYDELVAVRDGAGRIALLGLDADGVAHATSERGRAGWHEWTEISDELGRLDAVVEAEGYLHLIAGDDEGGLWYVEEDEPGAWGEGWEDLELATTGATALLRRDGMFEVYALDVDGAVWRLRGRDDWGAWEPLGGRHHVRLRAVEDARGEVELFALGEAGWVFRRTAPAPAA